MIKAILTVFLFFYVFFAHSSNWMGSKEEIFNTVKNSNDEPAYLKLLMEELSTKLASFIERKQVSSPREKLALLIIMNAYLEYVWSIVDGAKFAFASQYNLMYPGKGFYSRLVQYHDYPSWFDERWKILAKESDSNTRNTMALFGAREATKNATDYWNEIRNIKHGFNREIDNNHSNAVDIAVMILHLKAGPMEDWSTNLALTIGRLSVRLTEWKAQNERLVSADSMFEVMYKAIRAEMPDFPKGNPFNNQNSWLEFREKHFGHLSSNTMINPWLVQFDRLMLSGKL